METLLGAMNKVRKQAPDVHLTLHGGGEYRKKLQDLVRQMELQEHVIFDTKFVKTEELPGIIRNAHLGVIPYRNGVFTGEILPTKLLEYAALGLPVICSRTQIIEDYFDETMVAFFTPDDVDDLADVILRLYKDRKQLDNLAQNIHEFNKKYNWSDQSSEYTNLIKNLIAN